MTTAEMSISNKRTNRTNKTSLGTAALIAGIGLLIMVIAAPYAELYAYPKLVVPRNAAQTVQNISRTRHFCFGHFWIFDPSFVMCWSPGRFMFT